MCFQHVFLARQVLVSYLWMADLRPFSTPGAGVDGMGGFSMCLFSSKVDGNINGNISRKDMVCVCVCVVLFGFQRWQKFSE